MPTIDPASVAHGGVGSALWTRASEDFRVGAAYLFGLSREGASWRFMPGVREGWRTGTKWYGKVGGAIKGGGLRWLGPVVAVKTAATGWAEGGPYGATKEVAKETALWGIGDIIFQGVGRRAKSLWGGMAGRGAVGRAAGLAFRGVGFASRAVLPIALVAASAWLVGTQARASYIYHLNRLPLETAGSLSSFQTKGALTMRARSMQAIQRSHLNARTAFGNEAASWADIHSIRGYRR